MMLFASTTRKKDNKKSDYQPSDFGKKELGYSTGISYKM